MSAPRDSCAGTAVGARLDAGGCAVSARTGESDRDGIPHAEDDGPDTGVGIGVDAEGCPVPEGRCDR